MRAPWRRSSSKFTIKFVVSQSCHRLAKNTLSRVLNTIKARGFRVFGYEPLLRQICPDFAVKPDGGKDGKGTQAARADTGSPIHVPRLQGPNGVPL